MEGVASNKVVAMSVAVILLLGFACSMAAATSCADVGVQIQPCVGLLQGNVAAPPAQCCDGLAAIQKYEAELGINPTCNCTKGLLFQIPGLSVDVQFSVDVQNNCSVSLGFSLDTNSGCQKLIILIMSVFSFLIV